MTKTIEATTVGVKVGTVIRLDNGAEKALEAADCSLRTSSSPGR